MQRRAYYYAMQQARMAQQAVEDIGAEAVGVTPGKVTLRVNITALFNLKPATDK